MSHTRTTQGQRASWGRPAGAACALALALVVASACSVSDPNFVDATNGGKGGAEGLPSAGNQNVGEGGSETESGGTSGLGGRATGEAGADSGGGGTGGTGPQVCGAAATPCCASGPNDGCGIGLVCDLASDACVEPNPCDGSDPTECVDIIASGASNFGSGWRSSWFFIGCVVIGAHDCLHIEGGCPNQDAAAFEDKGAKTLETFPIAGKPGQHYKVTFTFNGVSEGKYYTGGSRDQADDVTGWDSVPIDTFYRDGSPIPSSYNTWKVTVFDEEGVEARHYYMNSYPQASGAESHRMAPMGYTKSIVVIGGGYVKHQVQDSNCRSSANCGPGDNGSACPAPRLIPNEPANVPLPSTYGDPSTNQPVALATLNVVNGANQPWQGQIGHLTVTAAEETGLPVTHDYP